MVGSRIICSISSLHNAVIADFSLLKVGISLRRNLNGWEVPRTCDLLFMRNISLDHPEMEFRTRRGHPNNPFSVKSCYKMPSFTDNISP